MTTCMSKAPTRSSGSHLLLAEEASSSAKLARLLPILLVLALPGCDVDLFNSDCRSIGESGYALCREENRPVVFYIEPAGELASGGGVLEGTVRAIGWNEQVIVADRKALSGGDPDGPMVLDIASKKVEGPFDQDAVARKYPSIKLSRAADAWEALR